MSDNMPDFDNMSQEEITAWLETLAKRQGASEGFTTAADMDIAEVDPDTVVIDEPGYIPYGQETAQAQPQQPAPVQEPPRAPEPEATPIQPIQPVYTPQPAAELPPIDIPEAPPVQPPQPEPAAWINLAQAPPPSEVQPPQPEPATWVNVPAAQRPEVQPPQPEPAAPVEQGGLAWLASLAADQDEEIFNLDLSDLPTNTVEAEAPPTVINPMTWLEDLARAQVAEPSLERLGADEDDEDESEKLNPYAQNADPMEWLETLAKRQGANPEELTTGARMKIPAADEAEVEEPGYEPFSFDTPPTRRAAEPVDTADWLSSLAGAEGYSESGVLATQRHEEQAAEEMSMSAIESAINAGTVTPDQMQHFLDQQAEQLAVQPDEEYELVDEDEALAPAEMPDWLSELKPQPSAPNAEPTKPLDALFETPAVPEMPDWLRQDMVGDEALMLASIFEADEEASQPFVAITDDEGLGYEIEVDANDPWVEAFDLEYEQGGAADAESVPAWYEQNLNDPARIAAVERELDVLPPMDETTQIETPIPLDDVVIAAVALEEAQLSTENDLPAGQPQEVPAWASGVGQPDLGDLYTAAEDQYDEQFVEEAAAFEDGEDYGEIEIPDWLKEVETSVSPEDVPAWLVQTIALDAAAEVIEAAQEVPEPVVAQQPPVIPSTPPPPAQAATVTSAESAEVLNRARDKEQGGDLEGALAEYESMVRSSVDLESVVADLTQLTKSYKTTPAVFRVLGDGLMRQGKLQAALNTYREALNQL